MPGRFKPSFGGTIYVAHFVELNKAKSNAFFLKFNADLAGSVDKHTANVKTTVSQYGYRVHRIHCEIEG